MKQMKKLLAVLLALVMMASFVTVAVSAEDPAATPLFTWQQGFSSSGTTYWGGFPSAADGSVELTADHYTPVGAANFFYNGPISGWQAMHYGFWGGKTLSTTDLSAWDGLCFFLNVSSEHKFDIPGLRLTASVDGVNFTFIATPEVLEKDTDVFVYLPWSAFANDQQEAHGKVELKPEHLTNMTNNQIQIYCGKWNESPSYKPTLKFTISDLYGYKTNGSENPDEFTFEIPHDPSVKNLPAYFADRVVDNDKLAAVKAAFDAAEAKIASVAIEKVTAADIEVLQAFLDAYDTANSATQEELAKVHNITKDAQADTDAWYRIDAMRQEWADYLAWIEGQVGNNDNNQGGNQGPVQVQPTAKKPAKVKGVKITVGKKKATVKWNKAKNAKTYVVKYSYKKNMKKAKTLKVKKAKTKLVIKKLKSGKKIYVQVQGVNGKVKGKFSAKKASKKIK